MGEIGVYLRQLKQLDEAEEVLHKALLLIETHLLGVKFEVQQKIRLVHVYQWKKRFKDSNNLLLETIQKCRELPEVSGYLAFALQHMGKNLFDQNRFDEALTHFEEALQLRIEQNSPVNQIDSTKLAIQVTIQRINSK